MKSTDTIETSIKALRDGIAALEKLQTSTARIESERAHLLEQHDGSLSEKFLVRFASIEAGTAAARELEALMADRLTRAVRTAQQIENYGINDLRGIHSQIDDAIEAHVLAAAPEDIRDGLNVWATKTAIAERTARPSLVNTTIGQGQTGKIQEIIGNASALAANLTLLSIEAKRCADVAKRFGAKIEQAA